MHHLTAFLVVSTVVIATPGPDTALTIKNSLLGGRRGGVFTAAGVAIGQATWSVTTSAGLAGVLLASENVFRALKYLGAAYLAYLGVHALVAAVRNRKPAAYEDPAALRPRLRSGAALRQGLFSNLTNPKMIAFFPALLPQFASGSDSPFRIMLILGLAFSLMTLTWLTGYSFAVAKAADFLRRRQIRRTLEGATGVVLIGLGLRLATEG